MKHIISLSNVKLCIDAIDFPIKFDQFGSEEEFAVI